MWKWIDSIPLMPLVAIAALLAVLPVNPAPHLIEKLAMLVQGALVKPLDIFDLFLHGAPAVILLIRVIRMWVKK